MTAAQTALLGSSDCQKLVWSDMAIVIAAKARCPTQESPSGHLVRRRRWAAVSIASTTRALRKGRGVGPAKRLVVMRRIGQASGSALAEHYSSGMLRRAWLGGVWAGLGDSWTPGRRQRTPPIYAYLTGGSRPGPSFTGGVARSAMDCSRQLQILLALLCQYILRSSIAVHVRILCLGICAHPGQRVAQPGRGGRMVPW